MNQFSSLDDIDRRLLEMLAANARASLKELGAAVGMSSPSVAERLRKLEERGVVRAFTIVVDPASLGLGIEAIVRIRPAPSQLHAVARLIDDCPNIVECDKVTGDDCFVVRLHARSITEIDAILDPFAERAATSTSIVKSKPVARRTPPLA